MDRRDYIRSVGAGVSISAIVTGETAANTGSFGSVVFVEAALEHRDVPEAGNVCAIHGPREYSMKNGTLKINGDQVSTTAVRQKVNNSAGLIKSQTFDPIPRAELSWGRDGFLNIETGEDMLPGRQLQIMEQHDQHPQLTVGLERDVAVVNEKDSSLHLQPRETVRKEYTDIKITIEEPSDEFEMVENPRTNTKEKSRIYNERTTTITPTLEIQNHGSVDVINGGS